MSSIPITPKFRDWIERQAVEDIAAAYASAERRGAPEPVITAGILADDWSANYSAHRLEYLSPYRLRKHIENALRRLKRAGKLTTSLAMKGNLEVIAYSPAEVTRG